jgi:hypothetical protein
MHRRGLRYCNCLQGDRCFVIAVAAVSNIDLLIKTVNAADEF